MNNGTFMKSISGFQLIFKSLRRHRECRYSTKSLMDVATRLGDYELTKAEQNTLFKNTLKMIQNYHSSSKATLM